MGFYSRVVSTTTTAQQQEAHMDILALVQPINGCLSKTAFRQMSRVIFAMLAMTGRVTMLGLSRWAGDSGNYRTIQRFYQTAIPWAQLFWQFF